MNMIKIEITISDVSYLIDTVTLLVRTKIPSENRDEMVEEMKEVLEETVCKAMKMF